MGDSLRMTHVHTGGGSRLPASTLAMSPAAWQGGGDGEGMVLNPRAFTICERKASRLQTYSPSGNDSFASLSLLQGQGSERDEKEPTGFCSCAAPPRSRYSSPFGLKKPKNNLSCPPHPGPWEITSNSSTNVSHLLQMNDGKAAVLRAPFLLPSGSSCCPAMPAPASLPRSSPACLTPKDRRLCHLDLAHRCGAELEPQAAPGANSLPAAEAPLPFPRCLRGWTQPVDVQCKLLHSLGKRGTFLTFPPFHCPTGRLILLPMFCRSL